ncbi:MAG: hypothetical protein IJW46_06130 [Clostridia bacterium]|nr:hypothetical protein [Clostridia bacterium]
MMLKRILSLFLLLVLSVTLVSCTSLSTTVPATVSKPPQTTPAVTDTHTPPTQPSLEALLNAALLLKPEGQAPTSINILCTKEACDAIWIDVYAAQRNLTDVESAIAERLFELQNRLNVTLVPFVPECREGESFWEAAVRCLSAPDTDIDLVIGPSNEPIPTALFSHLSKLTDCYDPSGNDFFTYMPSDRLAKNDYFVNGQLLSSYHGSALVTFLNTQLAGIPESTLSTLRQSITEGTWTLDRLIALAKSKQLPITCQKDLLADTLALAFGTHKADATVKEAITALEAEGVLLDTDDPYKAYTEERALAVFTPIGTPLGDVFSFTTTLPLPKKDTAQTAYGTGAPNGFDIIAVNRHSEKKALSAATILMLEVLSDEDYQHTYFKSIYACRCLCERRNVWEETEKICREGCIFHKIHVQNTPERPS